MRRREYRAKTTQHFFALLAGYVGFKFSISFFGGIGYNFLSLLIGEHSFSLLGNPAFMITIHAVVALCASGIAYQVAMNRYLTILVKVAPVVYVVLAFGLIMLKSRGVQGVNFNFADVADILLWQPATFFFNLFVLVPLGCIFRTKAVPVGKSIIAAILIVLVCESLQYVCKLGIFDVIDIVSHVIGFIFGFYLADALIDFGLHFSAVNEHICSLTRKN